MFLISPSVAAMDATYVMERAGNSIVTIFAMKGDEGVSQGSGIIASSTGVILTNYHVIEGADQLIVKTTKGDIYDDVEIVDYNVRMDLTVIKIKAIKLIPAVFGDSDNVKVGQAVVAIGNPEGLENTISQGIISQVRDSGNGYKVFQSDATITHGSSGGALLNAKGEVIGITSFKFGSDAGENLGFSLPINYAMPYISETPKMTIKEFYEQNSVVDSHKKSFSSRSNSDMSRPSYSDSVESYLNTISDYLDNGDTEGALYALESCMDEIGLDFTCNLMKGKIYLDNDAFESARYYLELARNQMPVDMSDGMHIAMHCSLGDIYFIYSEMDKAVLEFEQCYDYEDDPEAFQVYGLKLLHLYMVQEDWHGVDVLSNNLIELAPSDAIRSIALVIRGIGKMAEGSDFELALDDFAEAIILDKNNGNAYCALGWTGVWSAISSLSSDEYDDVVYFIGGAASMFEMGIQLEAFPYICDEEDLKNIKAANKACSRRDFEALKGILSKIYKRMGYVFGY